VSVEELDDFLKEEELGHGIRDLVLIESINYVSIN
jgi:hypothetical protein